MKKNKKIGWVVIVAILILILFITGLQLIKFILNFFNDYHGLFTIIIVSVGFYFIWRQIKISKDQDILFRFQDLVSKYFTSTYKEHNQCYKDVESLLKRCLLVRDKNELNFIAQTNDTSNLGNIAENLLKKYAIKPLNNTLTNNACYELWLGSDYKKFIAILEGENFNKVNCFHKIYQDIMVPLSKIEILYSSEQSYRQVYDLIFDKIKQEFDNFDNSYNQLSDEFNNFFKYIAKNKGI